MSFIDKSDRDTLDSFAGIYRRSASALHQELGRTPTAQEVAQRVVRALQYCCRCNAAEEQGMLALGADDFDLLAEADVIAKAQSKTQEFHQLALLLVDYLPSQM